MVSLNFLPVPVISSSLRLGSLRESILMKFIFPVADDIANKV